MNVSSIAGIAGIGSSVAYAASKGALNTMTYSLARALAPGGPRQRGVPRLCRHALVREAVRRGNGRKIAEGEGKRALLQRVADGEEIAKTVLFFAGPESRNITGETLLSDGGMHLSMAGARR